VTDPDIDALKGFGRRMARLSPEQIEKRKWAKWADKLRRREDILAYETQQDNIENKDDVYR